MDKIISYIKKNSSQCIFISVLLILFIVMIVLWVRRGTFSLDENYVLLKCTDVSADATSTECKMTLHYNSETYGTDNKILSVSGHFSMPEGLEYQFVSSCGDTCDIDENSKNGFAIGRTAGLDNDWLFGKLIITVPTGLTSSTDYEITLIDLGLSDNNDAMIYLTDSSDTLTLTVESGSDPGSGSSSEPIVEPGSGSGDSPSGDPSGEVSYNLTFDNTIKVSSGEEKVIYGLPEGEDYNYLLGKITTNYSVSIYNRNGTEISQNSKLKTYDKIVFTGNNQQFEYKISVMRDINGDGVAASIGDVAKLHDFYRRIGGDDYTLDEVMKYTGDINGDGTAAGIGDVAMLHNLYKSIQK